jgi:hypothetical protein
MIPTPLVFWLKNKHASIITVIIVMLVSCALNPNVFTVIAMIPRCYKMMFKDYTKLSALLNQHAALDSISGAFKTHGASQWLLWFAFVYETPVFSLWLQWFQGFIRLYWALGLIETDIQHLVLRMHENKKQMSLLGFWDRTHGRGAWASGGGI